MKKSASTVKPVLKHFANFWSLAKQPTADREWTLEQKLAQAKKAGFDAIGGGADAKAAAACQKAGLDYVCYIDGTMKTYPERLEAALATHPARINAQVCDHDTPPQEAV